MRNTSIEAYNSLLKLGLLTGLRGKVYDTLYSHGPMTQGELWNDYFPTSQRHSIAPRFAELEKLGLIQTVGQRPCNFSDTMSLVWDVTDKVIESKDEVVVTPKVKAKDILPDVVALLSKVSDFLGTLPEGGTQEILHYDVNQLLEKLK